MPDPSTLRGRTDLFGILQASCMLAGCLCSGHQRMPYHTPCTAGLVYLPKKSLPACRIEFSIALLIVTHSSSLRALATRGRQKYF